ncbi:MAG: DUF3575 domain-containing protein [Bacteroidota bacterium]
MKTIFSSLFLTALLFAGSFTHATAQSNIVKVYPLGWFSSKFALQYENVFSDNKSFTIYAGYRSSNFGGQLVDVTLDGVETTDVLITDGKQTGLQINPSIRFYSKKKNAPEGLYLAPGLQFTRSSLSPGLEVDQDVTQVDINVTAGGLALDIGYQWVLADIVTIDWTFVGFGFRYASVSGTASIEGADDARTAELVQDLNDYFDEIDGLNLEFAQDGTAASITQGLPWPILRARLAIGVLF